MAQAATWSLQTTDYQQLTEVQHLLKRPDMYIGPIERTPRLAKCMVDEKKIVVKQVATAMGEEHLFVEIIGNIADNVQRSRESGVDPGHAEITMDQHWMTAKNYGMFIPIDVHPETGKWIPDMIFGTFRAGSNFDDSKIRLYIGKNGIGAKGVNGFSQVFITEHGDPIRAREYKQMWQNNMNQKSEPQITSYQGPGYTKISYLLDFARFGVASYDQEVMEIYRAHCAALSYACQIPIVFNGVTIQVPDLFHYAAMFFPVTRASAISYTDPNNAYDLCLIDTPNEAVGISFVNGILTPEGGVHLDAAYHVVTHALINYLGKAIKGITLTKRDIVDHVSVFISCRLAKAQFVGQTKEKLKSPEPKLELPEKLLTGIRKWDLIKILNQTIERKQLNKLKKTDGKGKRFRGGKGEGANWAGGANSMNTVFILTEGLSADSYRLKFVSQVPNGQGRNIFGSMPLHGKPRNVLNADFIKILEDEDFKNIKQYLGLAEDVDYTVQENYRKLNYGALWMFPDPDNDGRHILALILLFFAVRFFSLVKSKYIKFLRIPVARTTIDGTRVLFYTMSALRRTLAALPPGTVVGPIDYFKGLGSSEDHHIKEDFANPRVVTFEADQDAAVSLMQAFHKTQSHLRKDLILNWLNQQIPDIENYAALPISVFIHQELIEYWIENVIRSIPEAIDGLKESQRKALFAAFRKLRGKGAAMKKIKVAQVASHAAEITCYKHGESCLADTIVMMTYNFVGSNNMPYFEPKGQFGCVDPETPILTWKGTRKSAKDITIDDVLIGDDGAPRHISKVVSGIDHMYTINQQYGNPYRVNSEHVLTLHFPKHKVIYWKDSSLAWSMEYFDLNEKEVKSRTIRCNDSTKDAAEKQMRDFAATIPDDNIFDINIQTYLSFSPSRQKLFRSVRSVTPVKWPKRDVPIAPYIFGTWLGDGLNNNKWVPEFYIVNDVETRLQLLAGLIDTNGCLKRQDSKASQFFEIETHDHIIDAAEYIAKSLGFKTVVSISVQKVLHINGDIYRIPTRLPRNRATKTTCQNYLGGKIDVQYASVGEYVGWHLDSNERFLLGDFTVTHNTRNQGGEDAANPRYTGIALAWWLDKVIRKEDKRLEKRIEDEGSPQECENFFPNIPIHLVNGQKGIGSGWSTDIPPHHPLDLAFWLQMRNLQVIFPQENYQLPNLRPYFKGFTGQILPRKEGFSTEGRFKLNPDGSVDILELPIGKWTLDYAVDFLEAEVEAGHVTDYDTYCTDDKVHYHLHDYLDGTPTMKKLKLITDFSYKNMTVLYRNPDRGIRPKIYTSVPEMMEDFYQLRIQKYKERIALQLQELDRAIVDLGNRARYIFLVAVEKSLEIRGRPKKEILAEMERLSLPGDLLKSVKGSEFSQDEITDLQQEIERKKLERVQMEQIRSEQIYYNELEEFILAYCNHEKCHRSTYDSCNPLITVTLTSK